MFCAPPPILFPGLGFAGLFFLYTPLVSCIIFLCWSFFFGYFVRPFSLGPVETPPHRILLTVHSHHSLAVRIVGPWPAGPGSIPGDGILYNRVEWVLYFFPWKQWCWNVFFGGLTIPPPFFLSLERGTRWMINFLKKIISWLKNLWASTHPNGTWWLVWV